MNWKCLFGLHDWKIEYFGNGFPMRECSDCGKVQVKPIGSFGWYKAGEGTTLETTRKLYARFAKQDDIQQRHRTGIISLDEYIQETEELRQSFHSSTESDEE